MAPILEVATSTLPFWNCQLYFRKWLVIFEIFENNFIRKFLRIRYHSFVIDGGIEYKSASHSDDTTIIVIKEDDKTLNQQTNKTLKHALFKKHALMVHHRLQMI